MEPPSLPAAAGLPRGRHRLLVGLAYAPLALLLAWQVAATWFLCDDAFILFRYARNLVDGQGLVFNHGERVEGFVCLAWVLELAALWRLGVRPEVAAPALAVAMTALTLGLVAAAARRCAEPAHRTLVCWLAVALVATSPSFAVWSTGGLETRQFTCLVLLGCLLLGRPDAGHGRRALASLVFGLAALTRPEALLLFLFAIAWRVAQDRQHGHGRRGHLVCLLAPFVAVAVAQFLWRHAYYGEWLPNPYHAKVVQPWYEIGFYYLAAATIELGAWLWVPLAGVTVVRRAAAGDLSPALPFVLVFGHALWLLRIGGDHFEYRPLDFYLPLLAAPAAAAVPPVLAAVVAALGLRPGLRPAWIGRLGALAALPLLLYSQGIPAASLAVARAHEEPLEGLQPRTRVDAGTAPALRLLPGLLPLCEILEPLRERLHRHLVAVPATVHRTIGERLVAGYAAYERLPRGVLPADAVTAANTVGVMPFYLGDLTVVDVHGLTDATVARTPVAHGNDQRRLAHDRLATPAYLEQRGVNLWIHPAAASDAEALRHADFALRVDDATWMPLDAVDREYAQGAFPPDRLTARHRVDSVRPGGNRMLLEGKAWDGVHLVATFEPAGAEPAWAFTGTAAVRRTGPSLRGGIGGHHLSTREGDAAAGSATARSPSFTAEPGTSLVLFLAGERALGLGVDLRAGDEVVRSFGPADAGRFLPERCALDAWIGQTLHLEVHDAGPGWLALDHCLLVREVADPRAPASATWSAPPPPFAGCVEVTPLRSVAGRTASGPLTITVENPLPCAIAATVDLVQGPAGSSLLRGTWTGADGTTALAAIPPGSNARLHAFLRLAEPAPVARQPIVLRLHARLDVPSPAAAAATIDLPLVWQDQN